MATYGLPLLYKLTENLPFFIILPAKKSSHEFDQAKKITHAAKLRHEYFPLTEAFDSPPYEEPSEDYFFLYLW